MSTPTASHQHVSDVHHPSPPGGPTTFGSAHASGSAPTRAGRASLPNVYQGPTTQPSPSGETHQLSPPYGNFHHSGQSYIQNQAPHGPVLPPFSSIQTMGPPSSQQSNVSSVRYQAADAQRSGKYPTSGSKRHAPASSNVTSAESSDFDEEDNGELPASGLVAPWEVLRGLADVAIERAAKVNIQLEQGTSFSMPCATGKRR